MKLPRYTAKTPPPGFAGAVRAANIPALTRTGAVEEAQALGGLGKGVGAIGESLYKIHMDRLNIEAGIQIADIRRNMYLWGEKDKQAVEDSPIISDDQRAATISSSVSHRNKYFAKISKGVNHIAQRELNKWNPMDLAQFEAEITALANGKLNDYQLSKVLEHVRERLYVGDIKGADALIESVSGTLLSAKAADSLIARHKERAFAFRYERLAAEVDKILAEKGVEPARTFVLTNEEAPSSEKTKLINMIERADSAGATKDWYINEEKQRQEVISLFGRLGSGKIDDWPRELEIKRNLNLDTVEKGQWQKVIQGLGKEEPKTDNKKLIELQMKLFDRWGGFDKAKDSEVLLETELASARYVERTIDDRTFAELSRQLNLDIGNYGISLKSVFEEMDKIGRASWTDSFWGRGTSGYIEAWLLSQEEAGNIFLARKALLDWVLKQKKDVAPDEIRKMGRRLIVDVKKGPIQEMPSIVPPEITVEPTEPFINTDEEYDALPSGTIFIDPNGERRRKP